MATKPKLKYSQAVLDAADGIAEPQDRAFVLMQCTHSLPIEEAHAVLDYAEESIAKIQDVKLRVQRTAELAGHRSRVDQRLNA